ncbi:MAG TPA: class I SAM-dependent methyltransferase [Acidobacteriaceae bacterium]
MMRRWFLALGVLALGVVGVAPCLAQDTLQPEMARLAALLHWHDGSVVAEIGAGEGRMTAAAAQRVGPSGNVYTNELDAQKLAHLRELATTEKNVTVVEGAADGTNLPPLCCDSVFMRLVYHHFTNPGAMDASLLRSLKPGGELAVIDEEPRPGSAIPDGVPKNRLGHGIPQPVLVGELKSAGFTVETIDNHWPSDADHKLYCVIFRKPRR